MSSTNPIPTGLSGLLRRLGLRGESALDQDQHIQPAQDGGNRLRELDEIAAFLSYHQLPVNARTLATASHYLAGSDPQIVRLIDRQVQARLPVTLDWLDEALTRQGSGAESAALDRLMRRLEQGIDDFSKTSQAAQLATSEYHSALSAQAGELQAATDSGATLAELAALTRAMIKRTREIGRAMQRSEEQTRTLRSKLEIARRTAEQDDLTGLPNRRAFESRFEAEYRAARAQGEPLCVAFCDIDHFKQVNDRHGHDAGDRVLKLVAENLARISNEGCHVARHGGEEFVLLFRNRSLDQAFAMLDRLRADLADRRLVNRATDMPIGQVTFSAGIADVFASRDRRQALKAADSALYRAKQEGRNRILVATAAVPCTAAHAA